MTIGLAQWTLDASDVDRLATFWSAALSFRIDRGDDGSVHLRPTVEGSAPSVWLQPTAGRKGTKNRLHLDFSAVDPAQEVERLLTLGARPCDVGQSGNEGFTVLADPEGNEFCVFTRPRVAGS